MKSKLFNLLKETLIIPIAGFFALGLISLTVGWNPLTLLLFWFLLVPILAIKLPSLFGKKNYFLKEAILGLVAFYAVMVFMIYEHSQSDFFIIMMISLMCNILSVTIFSVLKKQSKQAF